MFLLLGQPTHHPFLPSSFFFFFFGCRNSLGNVLRICFSGFFRKWTSFSFCFFFFPPSPTSQTPLEKFSTIKMVLPAVVSLKIQRHKTHKRFKGTLLLIRIKHNTQIFGVRPCSLLFPIFVPRKFADGVFVLINSVLLNRSCVWIRFLQFDSDFTYASGYVGCLWSE